jgi:hypothetical protein
MQSIWERAHMCAGAQVRGDKFCAGVCVCARGETLIKGLAQRLVYLVRARACVWHNYNLIIGMRTTLMLQQQQPRHMSNGGAAVFAPDPSRCTHKSGFICVPIIWHLHTNLSPRPSAHSLRCELELRTKCISVCRAFMMNGRQPLNPAC